MANLFGLLLLGSLIGLVVGVIKPTAFSRFLKNPTRKKILQIFGGLLLVSFIGFGMTSDTKTAISEPTNTPQALVLSEQDQVKALVTDQLKGTNNMKRDNLKKVEVSEGEGGGWNVTVEFNANDNFSTNLRKGGIEKKMSEIYSVLYQSGKDIKTTSITAYFPLADQYGNESDGVVYKSTLDKIEANKVNWQADESTLQLTILPRVWTTVMLHPEFR
ncbi:hypothetical protein COT86_00650 [Candidatus Collierbacteria bacterium CG10_big_fil_rev_8_21_14_0_10_43_36]|uniref:Uncharacterized protein n=2 Tax=Candidatus Collieribacteriota TaxID=1752725 RepID=A0A2H0DTF3_9BACT|nr:hypothetical protein [Candidatus Parcubacteria bacterium]PIP85351.1 MAG: hypothetical protein COW83_04705 [Candidatus Collierbacteria bacterium CG22_combo_CG10-13_8_21_14_all_43_12]PIS00047.1 MAG: hypothetical protein COT86_00650 [Candidatus Collierbacteria bacterium CG10_big_fil_rev_8_21_14_0_10_43_36]